MFQGHIDLDAAMPVQASAVPDVLFERGLYWASGRSGVVNLVAAHKWFNLAALKGRADAIRLRREVAELNSNPSLLPNWGTRLAEIRSGRLIGDARDLRLMFWPGVGFASDEVP